jgi:hypothetical protein
MDLKKGIAFALVVTVALNVMPSRVRAADEAAAAKPAVAASPDSSASTPEAIPVADLRASARDVVRRLADRPSPAQPATAYRATPSNEGMAMQGGGGGSKFGMVMMLVEIGVSVGASYYVYQMLKKQQASAAGSTGGQ